MKLRFLLIALLVSPMIMGCTHNALHQQAKITDITVEQANILIAQNPKIKIIDVRTPEEFSGPHVNNAINIDYNSPDFATKIKRLPKDKEYIVYCRSGNRSGKSMAVFKELGFDAVYNVTGGMNVWQAKGLPDGDKK